MPYSKLGGPAHNLWVIRLTTRLRPYWLAGIRKRGADLQGPFLGGAVIASLSARYFRNVEMTNPNRYRTVLLARKWVAINK